MKFIGKNLVIKNVKFSNINFYYFTEIILYYFISSLAFGTILIGANYLLPFIPKFADIRVFNSVLSKTLVSLTILFCPVFIFARKKLVDNIKENAMMELDKVCEDLGKIGVYTTSEELSKGLISEVMWNFGYGHLEEFSKSLHFKDIKGEYLALRETLYRVRGQITGCEVNLLSEEDYNYADKEVQKYLLHKEAYNYKDKQI